MPEPATTPHHPLANPSDYWILDRRTNAIHRLDEVDTGSVSTACGARIELSHALPLDELLHHEAAPCLACVRVAA